MSNSVMQNPRLVELLVQRAVDGLSSSERAELKQLLSISDSAAARWRQQQKLEFSLVGRKIYYRLADIARMIQEHKVNAKPTHNEQKEK